MNVQGSDFQKIPSSLLLDRNKQIVHYSDSWKTLLDQFHQGHARERFQSVDYFDVLNDMSYDPYTIAVWINELNSVFEEKNTSVSYDVPLAIQNQIHFFRMTAERLYGTSDFLILVNHIPIDPEKQIEYKYNRLFQALEVTSDAVIIFETEKGFIYNNRKFHELFHYHAEHLNRLSEQTSPGDFSYLILNQEDRVRIQRKIQQGTNWEAEVEMINSNGFSFTAYVRTSMIRRVGPGFTGYVVLIRDITSQKNDQEALVFSESRYRTLVEQIPAVIYILSRDSHFVIHYISPQINELTGYTQDDFIRNPALWLKIIHPDDMDHREQSFKIREPSTTEYRIITRDGTLKWIREENSPIRNEATGLMQTQGLIFDISDRKNLEEVLRQKSEEANHANQMKSKFLAAMSHDIRTPMHGVLGITQILKNTELDPMQSELLSLIETSGETLMNLLNDILDFSKIEAGQFQIANSSFGIRHVVRSALGPLHVEAQEKGIQFEIDFDSEIPESVIGDPHRISQILNNIAGNAVNYTDHGGVLVRFLKDETSPVAQASRSSVANPFSGHSFILKIEVIDTGVGIPESHQKEIFSSFYRIENESDRKRGTGLGTTIALQLTELMGGVMTLESPASHPPYEHGGPGSVFTIMLPLGIHDGPVEQDPAMDLKQSPEKHIEELENNMKHILVAEDNPINRTIIETMLKKLGYTVDLVENGRQAVEILKESFFDLVLMDLQMPEMDGYEAVEKIRKELQISIPIYAVTADAYPEDLERAIQMGMNGYITKPYKKEELVDLIENTNS